MTEYNLPQSRKGRIALRILHWAWKLAPDEISVWLGEETIRQGFVPRKGRSYVTDDVDAEL